MISLFGLPDSLVLLEHVGVSRKSLGATGCELLTETSAAAARFRNPQNPKKFLRTFPQMGFGRLWVPDNGDGMVTVLLVFFLAKVNKREPSAKPHPVFTNHQVGSNGSPHESHMFFLLGWGGSLRKCHRPTG